MEIIQLEALERVVRDGNFTRAAESMGLTQPAISTRISLLESELGGKLFERHGRDLTLTPLGEAFLPYALRMLSIMRDGQRAVDDLHKGRVGQVKIAAPAPFIMAFLVDTLETFRRENPQIDVLIRERDKATIYQLINDHSITLGLVNAPVFNTGMAQIARFRDPIVAVCAPAHPLAQSTDRRYRLEDIYPYTIFRVSMFPEMTIFIDELVQEARLKNGGSVVAVPMSMAARMTMLGQGITFLPASYARLFVDEGKLVTLAFEDMPLLESHPVLISNRRVEYNQAHEKFVSVLLQQLDSLRES